MTMESYRTMTPDEQYNYIQRLRDKVHLFDPNELTFINGMIEPKLDLDEEDVIDEIRYDFGCPAIRQYLDQHFPIKSTPISLPDNYYQALPDRKPSRRKVFDGRLIENRRIKEEKETIEKIERQRVDDAKYYRHISQQNKEQRKARRQYWHILYLRLVDSGVIRAIDSEFSFYDIRKAYQSFEARFFIGVFPTVSAFIDAHAAFYLPDNPTRSDYLKVEREIHPLYLWYKVGSGKSTRYYVFNDPTYKANIKSFKNIGENT